MYINQVIYKTQFPDYIQKCSVSDRVKTYFKDLYHRYKSELTMDMSLPIYNYDQLGKLLFHEIQRNGDLNSADTILFPLWAITWNMDYAVPEFHWKNEFGVNALFQDIRDCGSLCVYYALNILLTLNEAKLQKNVLCCSVENAWLPHENAKTLYASEINYIASLACSSDLQGTQPIKILSSKIFKLQTINSNTEFNEMINAHLKSHQINGDDFIIYTRKNDEDHHTANNIAISYQTTSGFIYYCLDMLFKNRQKVNFKYAFVIDYDESHSSMGVLLLQMNAGTVYA
ncbi:MAG: hypothetical protein ACD_29C00097G0005 [uncultured bacterium]|nr:MAG: hypothetical protein ACD_29C00097G0005 [uncultured bacterium]